MPRPYSKKTVDDAVTLLDTLASSCDETIADTTMMFDTAAKQLGIAPHTTAYRLADAAANAIDDLDLMRLNVDDELRELHAEAADLVRSGWMIGDPVDLLPAPPRLVNEPTGKLALNSTPEADAAIAAIEADHANIFEKSEKDYTEEVGATIDDGPTEAITDADLEQSPDVVRARRSEQFEADQAAGNISVFAENPYENGDYGADS